MSTPKNIPLPIPPGVYRQGTNYQAAGRWYDANGVRWHNGTMKPIGGWRPVLDATSTPMAVSVEAFPRGSHAWKSSDEVSIFAIGATNTGTPDTSGSLWIYIDGELTDITPDDIAMGTIDGAFTSGLYGEGPYGLGYYGQGGGGRTLTPPSTWQLDNFGGLLVACYTADGRLFYTVDPTSGDDAVVVPNAPVNNRGVVVTPEGFLVALGAGGDGRTVAWADQATLDDWTPSDTNQAGQLALPSRGTLLCGRRTRRQTFLWTDVDAYAMTYIGGEFVYACEQLGDGCGVIGPGAAVVLGDLALWMSTRGFFRYDGALAPIKCDVEDYVFDDLDSAQAAKVTAVANSLFNEVTWYYPSLADGTGENSRYVTYNWLEQHWSIGMLNRATGVDRGVHKLPILLDETGALFEHEVTSTRTGMAPFAVSGPVEIAEGDNVMQVQRILPDQNTLGSVSLTLFASFAPNGAERTAGPYAAAEDTPVRITGRQVRLRVDETLPDAWVFGLPRLQVVLGGRR